MNSSQKRATYSVLRNRFPATEYALLTEVSDAPGHSRSRSCDFVAVNMFPSRGLSITGLELKSKRTDWLKEKKNPSKQESIFRYCDYFYLLTDEEGVAKLDEIPEAWGWLHIKGNRVLTMKEAPKQDRSWDISRDFVCCLLKRATTKLIHPSEIEDKINEAIEKHDANSGASKAYLKKEVERYEKMIEDFQEASGIHIDNYQGGKRIGEAVKVVLNGDIKAWENRLMSLQSTAEDISDKIKSQIQKFKNEQLNSNSVTKS